MARGREATVGTALPAERVQELAEREGAKAYVVGDLVRIDGAFHLSARVVATALATVTTAPLPALRAYRAASRAKNAGDRSKAIAMARSALAIDSTFRTPPRSPEGSRRPAAIRCWAMRLARTWRRPRRMRRLPG